MRIFEYSGIIKTTTNYYLTWILNEGGRMVNLTDGAVNKFKEVVQKQGTAGDGVRIFVVPGG